MFLIIFYIIFLPFNKAPQIVNTAFVGLLLYIVAYAITKLTQAQTRLQGTERAAGLAASVRYSYLWNFPYISSTPHLSTFLPLFKNLEIKSKIKTIKIWGFFGCFLALRLFLLDLALSC